MEEVEMAVTLPSGEVSVSYHRNMKAAKRYLNILQKKHNLKKVKRTFTFLLLLIGVGFVASAQSQFISINYMDNMEFAVQLRGDEIEFPADICLEVIPYTTNASGTVVEQKSEIQNYNFSVPDRFLVIQVPIQNPGLYCIRVRYKDLVDYMVFEIEMER